MEVNQHQLVVVLLLHLQVEDNAVIVVLEEDQALLDLLAHPEDQEILEHQVHLDNLESPNKPHANKSQLHHASLALAVNQDNQVPQDHLDNPEDPDSLDSLEVKLHLESLDPLVHPDSLEHLDNPEALDNLEHLHNLKKLDLHLLAHQETLEHPDSLVILDQQVNLDQLEDLDLKDHLAHLEVLEMMDLLDNPDHLEHLVELERKEFVQNIVPLMEESSSKMELVVVKLFIVLAEEFIKNAYIIIISLNKLFFDKKLRTMKKI
jgi:hypothetical protein